eukprot:TRINITY_DN4522_c0_g1_i1.p1 TRINITY_DN4522_c0_g1~~TRINITY_DN4522_c0_g1_i1.p1  ORF type:complete len:586 (+),score=123.39 TRINITY_DN4522_c0_g1_i1:46-1758(+)
MTSSLIILTLFLGSVLAFSSNIVNTTYGPVQGYSAGDVNVWLGIPYAAPPVGSLRWRSPSSPQKWTEVRNTSTVPNACAQIRENSLYGSEDCLYLNIYAPKNPTFSGPLPVMFFIYGGGFSTGDGYLFGYYNGSNLATTQDVIVVTHNYRYLYPFFLSLAALTQFLCRVNGFGFLALKELGSEATDGGTGNYGVQDQRFALRWVKDNIKNFGGDPSKILVFGESAGAFSVCFHLTSEASFGLYQSAMIESGTCDSIDFFIQYDNAVSFGTDVATGIGCDRSKFSSSADYLSCLRSAPAENVVFAEATGSGYRPRFYPDYVWGPVIDNTESGLKNYPVYLVMNGTWARVPTAAGFNRDEGSVFLFSIPTVLPEIELPLNEFEVWSIIDFFWPGYRKQILDLYPYMSYDSPDAQMAAILRDYDFACAERRLLRAVSQQSFPAYMYHMIFDSEFVETKVVGIYHGYELAFVFDNQLPPNVHSFSEADQEMADTVGYYWGNFAKTQDPNVGYYGKSDMSILQWPLYNTSSATNLCLDLPLKTEKNLYSTQCDLWDQIFLIETHKMSPANSRTPL